MFFFLLAFRKEHERSVFSKKYIVGSVKHDVGDEKFSLAACGKFQWWILEMKSTGLKFEI